MQGAYGTGKSHAALTIKSILDASEQEVIDYFDDFGLSAELRDQYIALKANNDILTIHRIGSAGIKEDTDLILAVQQSIMAALRARGLENHGEASMRDAFLQWVSKKANYDYFSALIGEETYLWSFHGSGIEDVLEKLRNGTDEQIEQMMQKVMKVLKENGQYGIFSDVNQMAQWIRSVIKENHLSAILFIWDEFSEYFLNHPVGLTGFQTLAEISESDHFYFMIVAHQSKGLFSDEKTSRKTINRFEVIEIKLPENMAFRLMAQAMKKTDDPVLARDWVRYANALNEELTGVRRFLSTAFQKQNKLGQKTLLSDEEMQAIVPLHPYAALVLKHISALYNARSMFEFIIDGDENDGIAFKSYINTYGPTSEQNNLLTVDMLWNFFTVKGEKGLDDDVRGILGNFALLQGNQLLPEEQRVLKTLLLLQAVSLRVDSELLNPEDQNLELAFMGTDWSKGKALNVAKGLIDKGFLFRKPVAGGKEEYCVVSAGSSDSIQKYQDDVIKETRTRDLIVNAKLADAVSFPTPVKARYLVETTGNSGFSAAVKVLKAQNRQERFPILLTFALDDTEAIQIQQQIIRQLNMPGNNILFLECLTPMGNDLFKQYVDSMAFSKYHTGKDKDQATHYQRQAVSVLTDWQHKVAAGAFNLYLPEKKTAERQATLMDLQDTLTALNHQKYYYGLEQYSLNATMYSVYQLANGAAFGMEEKLSGSYSNKNKKMSFETALEGAWKVPKYWEDPAKQSLVIVHVKKKVMELVQQGFQSTSGRIRILSIVEELEKEPYGLLPSALAALVLGFVLKEYVTPDYFWSNGINSESMTVDKMKTAIANALNQKVNPTSKYKEEYIVAMSPQVRRFLNCTATVFHLSALGSVETARDQIRIKMKGLTFPLWCLKYILPNAHLESSEELLEQVIDCYTGIANTANAVKGSESELAEQIGRIVMENPAVETDLERIATGEQCRKGMLAYIGQQYRGGILQKLAEEIGDGGNYLDEVKGKFSAGDANWVWNTSTADEKISDVILEYQIIAESCKSLGKYTSLREVESAWNSRTNQIHISCEAVARTTGDLGPFLWQLCYLKQSGSISEQNKQKFYDLLLTQREAFDEFYKNQLPYFEQDANSFLEELDAEERAELFGKFPSGQFTKGKTEYYHFVEAKVEDYLKGRVTKQLREKWYEKTHTKKPSAWSEQYETPILCMFHDTERSTAREMLRVIESSSPREEDARKALEWMDNANFYARLENEAERDQCFMEKIVGDNAVLLKDVNAIRKELIQTVPDRVHEWLGNLTVQNQIRKMVDKQYKLTGCEEALTIIEKMDPEQLRKYLRERIQDDPDFGLQILKGE